MKKLLVLSAILFLASCRNYTPKYSYGTVVDIKDGFYKGLTGAISDWSTCLDRDTEETIICYKVEGVNGIFAFKTDHMVNEKDIVPHKQ